jgi:glycosyltransferase involved in cell wall biosynthesis
VISVRTEEYPRVLVVSASVFGRSSGTGITLSNLFAGWPRDRLAQLYAEDRTPDPDMCETFRIFQPRDAPVEYHLFRLLARTHRQPPTTPEPAATTVADAGTEAGRVRSRMRAQLRTFVDLTPIRVTGELSRWMRAQRPQVVYANLGSIRMMRLAVIAARECRVPLVPHFMDDWPATLYGQGQLAGLGRLGVRAALREVLRHTRYGMAISDAMAQEYRDRYGLPFDAFGNCVPIDDFAGAPHPYTIQHQDSVVNLVYVGGLHLNRWRGLLRVGEAAGRLTTGGREVRLTVHAPATDLDRYAHRFAGLPAVRMGDSVASDEVSGVLRRADILVHVESFARQNRRYTRYSLSTKIPQYLAAGRPVLGFGPAELASMAHLRAAGAGAVVGVDDATLLTGELARLCADGALRERLGRQGRAFGALHHRADGVAERFAEALRAAARRDPARS